MLRRLPARARRARYAAMLIMTEVPSAERMNEEAKAQYINT